MPGKEERQIRLSRLNIFLSDFREARHFAEYIIKKKLHEIKNPRAKAKLVHKAFDTSLVVSYSRPFHKSKEGDGRTKAVLTPTDIAHVLDEAEIVIHNKVLHERDTAHAHSDAIAHEIEGFDYSGRRLLLYKLARPPLTKHEIYLLTRMIRKWIVYLENRGAALNRATPESHDSN